MLEASITSSAAFVALLGLAALCGALVRPAVVVDRPRLVLALLAVVSGAALVALVRLEPPWLSIGVDPATEPMISRTDPGVSVYEQATRDFGDDDLYVVAMEVTGAGDVFSRSHLETLRSVTNGLRALPGVSRVESLARVPYVHWDAPRERVSIDRFMRRVPERPEELAVLRERALADPVYRKTLISQDARTAAINITFQPMTDTEFVRLELDERIRALLLQSSDAERRFYVSGRPHVRSQAYHLIVGDMATLVPVAVAVAAFVVWLMSGSVWAVVVPLMACLLGTLWVYGLMAVLGMDVNVVLLVLGPMMICLGSVYGVHVYARAQLITDDAPDARTAALRTIRYARTPVLMAGFTTCIGFGALLSNDIPATSQLGALSIFGIASVTLISLTGVPAALALLPGPRRRGAGGTPVSRWFGAHLERALGALCNLAVHRAGAVLAVSALLATGAVLLIPRIVIDTDFITFFRTDSQVRTDFEAVNELLAGTVPIYVLVSGEEEGAFREPEALRALERLQAELEVLPGVSEVLSSVDLIRLANRAMRGGAAEAARVPDTRSAVAEATFSIPKSQMRRFETSNHSRANLIIRSDQAGSASVRALEERVRIALAAVDLPEGFTTDVTGNTILLNRSADGVAENQFTQVGFAATTILLLIFLVFRSPRVALISMVPNVIPVLMFFGALGLGAAPLSLPTSLIGCIALGIAIDDTMHFLVAYQTQRTAGLSPEEAVRVCIHTVGPPIAMTSIMLVVGFLVILMSSFATLQEFGYLTAMTMGICLATDLVLLPALLVKLRA